MSNKKILPLVLVLFSFLRLAAAEQILILTGSQDSFASALAAREIRRYLYLRCGEIFPIQERKTLVGMKQDAIVLLQKGTPLAESLDDPLLRQEIRSLSGERYLLRTIGSEGRKWLVIAGADKTATLYGAYYFLEKMGVRFYLHGDTLPDERSPFAMPDLNETRAPLFGLRGIQPFHDFPEGPDWWNRDDYLAILGQLPKLQMNFFGLHTYPEGGPNAEPTVWIGMRSDLRRDGRVTFAYPASYQNTRRGNWGYESKKTGDFHYGADRLFGQDDFGADLMAGICPEPMSPADSIELFNRTADLFKDGFTFARSLGIKTCVGTETPLTVPQLVQQRIKESGKDPKSPEMIRQLYQGIFSRIAAAYPIDYYWFWTWEGWTWSDASLEQIQAVTADLTLAQQAAQEAETPSIWPPAAGSWARRPTAPCLTPFFPQAWPFPASTARWARRRSIWPSPASAAAPNGPFPGWRTTPR